MEKKERLGSLQVCRERMLVSEKLRLNLSCMYIRKQQKAFRKMKEIQNINSHQGEKRDMKGNGR